MVLGVGIGNKYYYTPVFDTTLPFSSFAHCLQEDFQVIPVDFNDARIKRAVPRACVTPLLRI